jgi:hypothetical protein
MMAEAGSAPWSVGNLRRPGVEYLPLAQSTPLVETGLAWGAATMRPPC